MSLFLDFTAFKAEGSESVSLLNLSVSLSDFSSRFPACPQIIEGREQELRSRQVQAHAHNLRSSRRTILQ